MANERQGRELTKCLNCLQQVPDYTQPFFQVMDAALAHVCRRDRTSHCFRVEQLKSLLEQCLDIPHGALTLGTNTQVDEHTS